jgi:8-oxo-dGTP pyrophosphatase MutT (NUDIX family)
LPEPPKCGNLAAAAAREAAPEPSAPPAKDRTALPHSQIVALREALARGPRAAGVPHGDGHPRAAVALVLRPATAAGGGLEVLLIRRADREGDPWSGHMAFPGGRADPRDADTIATAVRETREEVGIDLAHGGEWLGALQELHPRSGAPAIHVYPHVFAVPAGTQAHPNEEVHRALWVPLSDLSSPGAAAEHVHEHAGARVRFPAYAVGPYVVWGLTYRMLSELLALCAQLQVEATD